MSTNAIAPIAPTVAGAPKLDHMPKRRTLPCDEVDRLADEIAEISAHLDAATHRVLTLIRRFDEGSGWYTHGCLSCAQWLSWRIGLDLCAAREKVRVARALGALPHIDDALRRGQVSYSKVRALTRVATPENEASLLQMARSATASQLERICRGYRRAFRGVIGELALDEADRRWVHERSTESGMIRIEAQLTPEEAAVVMKALETAIARSWRAERASAETSAGASAAGAGATSGPSARPRRPSGLERADALVAIAEDSLSAPASESDKPTVEIVVHVEADSLADPASEAGGTLDDGTPLPRSTTERLTCDAAVLTVVEDRHGTPLDVGRRRRTVPTAIRRALRLRDKGCRYPGCTNTRVDSHHVVAWSRGGETKLSNLASLCRRHHVYVHELGYRIEPRPNGAFAFFAPAGWEVKPTCPPPTLTSDPVASLRAAHADAGIAIDSQTSFPRWDGTPPDYDHIVYVIANKYPPATA